MCGKLSLTVHGIQYLAESMILHTWWPCIIDRDLITQNKRNRSVVVDGRFSRRSLGVRYTLGTVPSTFCCE